MPSRGAPLRVLVAARDLLARAGLAALLADNPECTVVGQVSGDSDLAAEVEVYRPEVLLWDLGWDPTLSTERLAELPDKDATPIVALLPDEKHVAEVWAAGARALLLRDSDIATLLAALQAVMQGLTVIGQDLSPALSPAMNREAAALAEGLTPREMEVLGLLGEGLPNKMIAQRLGISEHTVKFHVNSILGKLGAQSRTEAVAIAARQGLILV